MTPTPTPGVFSGSATVLVYTHHKITIVLDLMDV